MNGARRQADALMQEGVEVQQGSLGEYFVDFATYGWFPDMLPSEEAESSDNETSMSTEV